MQQILSATGLLAANSKAACICTSAQRGHTGTLQVYKVSHPFLICLIIGEITSLFGSADIRMVK